MVVEAIGGTYLVRSSDGRDVQAVLRGKLKHEPRTGSRVVPGDRVRVFHDPEHGSHAIEQVLRRDNELVRSGPGGRKAKVVAANLDRCIVMLAATEPPFLTELADRFLALAESCRIRPVLVLNKVDLPAAAEIVAREAAVYASVGYSVIAASALTGEGTAELLHVLEKGVSAIVGPSGVGKSSLLNTLVPGHNLRTQPLSKGVRGRQTTVGARLIPLPSGGWVADTPGFSDVSLWEIDRRELSRAFPEFEAAAEGCRFGGCSHLHEPECGVRDAVDAGAIPRSRFESYRTIWEEIEARAPSYE